MLSLIKNFMSLFKSKSIPNTHVFTPTVQEDPRVHAAIKRTRAAFKQQEQAMNGRALKAHSASCPDPLTCKKRKCFKWSPDKIASEEYVVETHEQLQARKARRKHADTI